MTDTATAPRRAPARERLLAAATELFYAEGIHTVGIDRVIERAGVAKATLYNSFGSKDELVRAYLQQRYAVTRERVETELAAQWDDPRGKLLGMFTVQAERMAEPDYHGCPFASATAESAPGSPAHQAAAEYRDWRRELIVELAGEAGVTGAAALDDLARQFLMLYDGAALSYSIDGNLDAAAAARSAAATLLDAAVRAAAG